VTAHQVLAPARTLAEMNRVIFNDYFDAVLAGSSVAIVMTIVTCALFDIRQALSAAIETGGTRGANIGGGGNG
jgi:carbon starvation protein